MPSAVRVVDRLRDLSDVDAGAIAAGGMLRWNAATGKFVPSLLSDDGVNVTLLSGQLRGRDGGNSEPSFSFANAPTSGMRLNTAGNNPMMVSSGLAIAQASGVGWEANGDALRDLGKSNNRWRDAYLVRLLLGSADTILQSDAANIFALRNGANAQTARVYGTHTDASNYVRAALSASASAVTLAAESAGTGSANLDLNLTPKGTGAVKVTTGQLLAQQGTAGAPGLSFVAWPTVGFRATSTSLLRISVNGSDHSGFDTISFRPLATSNTLDLGGASSLWESGYFGTQLGIHDGSAFTASLIPGAVVIGTIPAQSGAVRLASGSTIVGRNSVNTADRNLLDWSVGNVVSIGANTGVTTQILSAGVVGIGGLTSGTPALKRSGTDLQVRLGDDSAYTNIDVLALKASGTKVVGAQGAAVADADGTLADATAKINAILARIRAGTGHGLISA